MRKIGDVSAQFFIIAVVVLTFVSILGVWDIFSDDVITKSFQTIGLLATVAVVIIVAGKYMDRNQDLSNMPYIPNPLFKSIRKASLTLLILSASFLTLLGILSIWEVIQDKDVLYKSMSSLGILIFGTFIIVMTALDREGRNMMGQEGKKMSGGTIVLIIFLMYMLFSMFSNFMRY